MRILVTGGTGFLGAYFVRYALGEGADVIVYDRYLDRGRLGEAATDVTLVEGDVTDYDSVGSLFAEYSIDRVAHFAFILGPPVVGQIIPYMQVQTIGTVNVFEAARLAGVQRIMYCSSVAAYGNPETGQPMTEDVLGNPTEPYGAAKLWGEALGRYYTATLGVDVVALRFSPTFGLGRAWRGSYNSGLTQSTAYVHFMARVEEAARGKPIAMPRDDSLADWTYAADAAQASWLALTTENLPHHLYNVCSEMRPVGEFTRKLRELLPEVEITSSETEVPHPVQCFMSNSRIKSDLGFAPKYSIEAGLEDYLRRIRAYDAFDTRRLTR
jgi:UDP-glucose 4-epimerase